MGIEATPTRRRARSRLYGALTRGGEVDSYRIVRPEALERFWAEQSFGADQVLMQLPTTRFSTGFTLSQPGMGFGPNIKAFVHPVRSARLALRIR